MADNFSSVVDSAMTPPASTSPRDMIMTLPAEIEKKQTAALGELKAKEQASMTKQDALYSDAMKKYNAAMSNVKPVEDANLQNPPDAPNQKFQDPTQVLGSLGTVLAIFGSMKTRAPMTSALNSMAAAMKGFHQGDQEAVKLNTEKWQNDFKKSLAQNQIEMQRYTTALEKNKFSMESAQSELRVLAVEMQDKQMHDAIEQGDYTKQSAILSGRLNAGMKGAETLAKMDATKAQQAQTNEMRKESLDLRRQELYAKSDKAAQKVVDEGKAGDRAVQIIEEMKGILQTNSGVTGMAGMVKRPMESVLSMLGQGEGGPAHEYESLARELQTILRQTPQFNYKGRMLSRDVANQDTIVRGMKFGDTGSISMDQLNHVENLLTGQGAGFSDPGGKATGGGIGTERKILDGVGYTKRNGEWFQDTP